MKPKDLRTRYFYKVYNLDNELIFEAQSLHDVARKLKVNTLTVSQRLDRKVHKNSDFRNENCKFNVTREAVIR